VIVKEMTPVPFSTFFPAPASCRGENAFFDQPFTEFDPVIVVDVEQDDGDAAHGRATDEVSVCPTRGGNG